MHSPMQGRFTSGFRTPSRPTHDAIDIAPPTPGAVGAPVVAMLSGWVDEIYTGSFPGNKKMRNKVTGNYVVIKNPDGRTQLYNHQRAVGELYKGLWVPEGTLISHGDRSGNQTGPHLHLVMRNAAGVSVNPMRYFRKHGIVVGSPTDITTFPVIDKPAPDTSLNILGNKIVKELGYQTVGNYQSAQRYWPGKVVDNDWGNKTEEHYRWTRTLQNALNGWKGDDLRVDGDLGAATINRVHEVMWNNRQGTYKGYAIDDKPGPVFCKMLGIPSHP